MDVLTVEHLTKKIGNKTILKDISLNLKRGQIVGLVGANGGRKNIFDESYIRLLDLPRR